MGDERGRASDNIYSCRLHERGFMVENLSGKCMILERRQSCGGLVTWGARGESL